MIGSLISSINGIGDLVDRIIKARDAVQIAELKIELQGKVLTAFQGATAAQARELEMGDTIRELKDRIVKLESWEAEKQRYELKQLAPGVVVRSLKAEMSNGEPPHDICANCYNRGEKRHIQQTVRGQYHDAFECNQCGEKLSINKGTPATQGRRGGGSENWM